MKYHQFAVYCRGITVKVALISACVVLGACSSVQYTTSTNGEQLTTGSVGSLALTTDGSDKAALENALTLAAFDRLPSEGMQWDNPDTGTIGIISTTELSGNSTKNCRTFATTLHRISGVELWRGTACQEQLNGIWHLAALSAADGSELIL